MNLVSMGLICTSVAIPFCLLAFHQSLWNARAGEGGLLVGGDPAGCGPPCCPPQRVPGVSCPMWVCAQMLLGVKRTQKFAMQGPCRVSQRAESERKGSFVSDEAETDTSGSELPPQEPLSLPGCGTATWLALEWAGRGQGRLRPSASWAFHSAQKKNGLLGAGCEEEPCVFCWEDGPAAPIELPSFSLAGLIQQRLLFQQQTFRARLGNGWAVLGGAGARPVHVLLCPEGSWVSSSGCHPFGEWQGWGFGSRETTGGGVTQEARVCDPPPQAAKSLQPLCYWMQTSVQVSLLP